MLLYEAPLAFVFLTESAAAALLAHAADVLWVPLACQATQVRAPLEVALWNLDDSPYSHARVQQVRLLLLLLLCLLLLKLLLEQFNLLLLLSL